MNFAHLLVPVLAAFAVGGVIYALAYPLMSGEAKAEKRFASMRTRSPTTIAARTTDAAKRKKQVAESLKELEARTKSKKLTFEMRMAQAGVEWSKPAFYGVSALVAFLAAVMAFLISRSPILVVCAALIFGLGLPRWILNYLRKRRLKSFLAELPAAVDIIVRGIKAGIPLGDCLRNIAAEAAEPVKTEFRAIVAAQSMGLSIAEAVERIVDRVPTAEANFFAIVINIQQRAGGNLAEALSNLSAVLRDRKKMRGKIKAMSSEAKASAGIIGALPPLVATIVYLTSPQYMSLLFTTSTGHIVLGVCVFWMSCGIFIMKKMINFDM